MVRLVMTEYEKIKNTMPFTTILGKAHQRGIEIAATLSDTKTMGFQS